jgi:hypothetical protein
VKVVDVHVNRKLGVVFGAMALAITFVPALAASSSAVASVQPQAAAPAAVSNPHQLLSEDENLCLDNVGNGVGLKLAPCIGAQNQEWGVNSVNGTFFRFQNAQNEACLAERSNAVVLAGCSPSSDVQQWAVGPAAKGDLIENVATLTCLSINTSTLRVELLPCRSAAVEEWGFPA